MNGFFRALDYVLPGVFGAREGREIATPEQAHSATVDACEEVILR